MTAIKESPIKELRPSIAAAAELTASKKNDSPTGSSAGAGSPVRVPLDVLAKEIVTRLDKGEQMYISAGRQLLEARERVQAGEAGKITWEEWCQKNIQKAQSTIRLAISFVKGKTDEEAAVAVRSHRQKNAGANRKLRERKSAPSRDSAVPHGATSPRASAILSESARESEGTLVALHAVEDVQLAVRAFDHSQWRLFWTWCLEENARRETDQEHETPERPAAVEGATAPIQKTETGTSASSEADSTPASPTLGNAAPTATVRASDAEIMSSQAYRQALEIFGNEADKAEAIAFASSVFRRKRSGEMPQSPTEWEQLCWGMPDAVRSAFVRHNVAPRAA